MIIRSSHIKFFALTYGPILALLLGYSFFSKVELRDLLSWERFSNNHGFLTSAPLALVCIVLYFFLIFWYTFRHFSSRGIILRIENGEILIHGRPKFSEAEIDFANSTFRNNWAGGQFTLRSYKGRKAFLTLAWAANDLPTRYTINLLRSKIIETL